jgi:predicted lipoprotein with Yx(FWY)xxD motif
MRTTADRGVEAVAVRRRSIPTFLSAGFLIAALALSACGDDDDSSNSEGDSAGGGNDPAATLVVSNTDLGDILTDGSGRTLYLFRKDSGRRSECDGACADQWPPLTVDGRPSAGRGVEQSLVGTTRRSDGSTQVTYNGHPVYRFEGDQSRGDTAGQGLNAFGAAWYVLSPAGDQVTHNGSQSGGGSGY